MTGDLHLVYYLRDESINTRGGKEREERKEREGTKREGERREGEINNRSEGEQKGVSGPGRRLCE